MPDGGQMTSSNGSAGNAHQQITVVNRQLNVKPFITGWGPAVFLGTSFSMIVGIQQLDGRNGR